MAPSSASGLPSGNVGPKVETVRREPHGRVSSGGLAPSNLRKKSLSSTRRVFGHGWARAATTILLATAAAALQGEGEFGATAVADEAEWTSRGDGGEGSDLRQGARTRGVSAQDIVGGRRPDAFGATGECIESLVREKEVDPENYMFGCKEVEEMLDSSPTLVGNGQMRHVYLAEYREQAVVLKVLQEQGEPRMQNTAIEMHQREAISLDAVRGHPNIVEMLGICNTTLVTEYYSTSLDRVIWVDRKHFTTERVVSMALDAARGLRALHEVSKAPIVHFDLKPRHLLIAEDGRVLLNDLTAAQFMGARWGGFPCPFTAPHKCQVVAWRAPENIAGKPLTEKVDVYAMGMIFYSLISGHIAFPMTEEGSDMILRGERPPIDPSWHTGFMQVVQDMWQEEPTDRPSARRIEARLEEILDSLP